MSLRSRIEEMKAQRARKAKRATDINERRRLLTERSNLYLLKAIEETKRDSYISRAKARFFVKKFLKSKISELKERGIPTAQLEERLKRADDIAFNLRKLPEVREVHAAKRKALYKWEQENADAKRKRNMNFKTAGVIGAAAVPLSPALLEVVLGAEAANLILNAAEKRGVKIDAERKADFYGPGGLNKELRETKKRLRRTEKLPEYERERTAIQYKKREKSGIKMLDEAHEEYIMKYKKRPSSLVGTLMGTKFRSFPQARNEIYYKTAEKMAKAHKFKTREEEKKFIENMARDFRAQEKKYL